MQWKSKEENYAFPSASSTGSISDFRNYRLEYTQFEKYEIGVILDSDGRFIGIAEVREQRDFLSPKQRISKTSAIDVDKYYKE